MHPEKEDQRAARMKAATELRSLTNSPKAAKLAQSLEQQAEQRGAEVEAVAEEQCHAAFTMPNLSQRH